jgi:hypothetical protein
MRRPETQGVTLESSRIQFIMLETDGISENITTIDRDEVEV